MGCKRALEVGRIKIVGVQKGEPRCPTCYSRHRRRQIAYGRARGYVSPERAQRHLLDLQQMGKGYRTISEESGISIANLWGIRSGKRTRITTSTEQRILAVAGNLYPATQVSALGACRRLQGLYAIGWDWHEIERRTGLSHDSMIRIAGGRRPKIQYRTHERIDKAYRQLEASPGPSDRARRHAQRRGWVSAWLWDDHDLDDPNAEPHADGTPVEVDEVLLLRIVQGRKFKIPQGSKMVYARVLMSRGWTVTDVDRALKLSSLQLRELRQIYNSTKETE